MIVTKRWKAEAVPAPPGLRAGAPLGLGAGSRLGAPFSSPRDARLYFAGDGVDSRRCIGHIEVECKLRALRLEQTQLQPPCCRQACERLVIQTMHRPVTRSSVGTALDWGIVVKFDAVRQTGWNIFCDHYGEMPLRKLGGFEAFDLQVGRPP